MKTKWIIGGAAFGAVIIDVIILIILKPWRSGGGGNGAPTGYTCDNNAWSCTKQVGGTYSSKSDCEANCKTPVTYVCNQVTGKCDLSSEGTQSKSECSVSCKASAPDVQDTGLAVGVKHRRSRVGRGTVL